MPATCALVTVDYPGFWDSTINKDTPHEKYLLKKKNQKRKNFANRHDIQKKYSVPKILTPKSQPIK